MGRSPVIATPIPIPKNLLLPDRNVTRYVRCVSNHLCSAITQDVIPNKVKEHTPMKTVTSFCRMPVTSGPYHHQSFKATLNDSVDRIALGCSCRARGIFLRFR